MSEMRPEEERDPIAEEEADAAAAEAAEIGGPAPDDQVDDPAQRPLVEGGEGEAEGFELAEAELMITPSTATRTASPTAMLGSRRSRPTPPTANRTKRSTKTSRRFHMPRRVIAVVTDELHGAEPVEHIRAHADGDGVEVRVVVPAVEANALAAHARRHRRAASSRPRSGWSGRCELLRQGDVKVSGEVGDPDPGAGRAGRAAESAGRRGPDLRALRVAGRSGTRTGCWSGRRKSIEPPLRMVVPRDAPTASPTTSSTSRRPAPGTVNPLADKEFGGGAYVPGMTRADLAGMVAGIVGTIVVAVLAAAVAAGSGHRDRLGRGGDPDRDRRRPGQPRPRRRPHPLREQSATAAASPSSSAPWR